MAGKSDILLLTSSYGGGHRQAALALGEALTICAPHIHHTTVDFIKEWNPALNRLAEASYCQAVVHAPFLWREFYAATARSASNRGLQRAFNRLFIPRARRLLATYRPRVVVCFYPVPATVMAQLKADGETGAALVTVITDQTVHSQWLHPGTDLYLVGSNQVRDGLIARGIPPERVVATGIPVSPAFARTRTAVEARRALNLDQHLPVVIVTSGAQGMFRGASSLCHGLVRSPVTMQVVVIAGHNERLRARVARATAGGPNPALVLGFVSNMAEWMAAADLLVGKAGGLTTTEALARNLPMVIINPIPGQEEANTDFLTSAGAAIRAQDTKEAIGLVEALLADPEGLQSMRRAARRIARPRAAFDAAARVLAFLDSSCHGFLPGVPAPRAGATASGGWGEAR